MLRKVNKTALLWLKKPLVSREDCTLVQTLVGILSVRRGKHPISKQSL